MFRLCPSDYICLPKIDENPDYGYTNFDHIGYSLLTSFQLITLDYWENVYNMVSAKQGCELEFTEFDFELELEKS